MVIKYGGLGALLASLMYKDTLEAFGEADKRRRNPDGSQSSALLNSFLKDEPCLVQETTQDSSRDGNMDVARQETVVTVFCRQDCGIKKGNVLILSITDDNGQVIKKIEGHAAEPTFFPDHLEINLYDWKVS